MSGKIDYAVEQVIKMCEITPNRPVLIASPDAEQRFVNALKRRGLTVYKYAESQVQESDGIVMWHAVLNGGACESA